MQSSILSFSTNQSTMKSHLSSMYCIDLDSVDEKFIERHTNLLRMQPKARGPKPPEPFDAFIKTDTQLCVPRFYGIATFGNPTTTSLTLGETLGDDVEFVQELFPDQVLAHSACMGALKISGGCVCVRRAGGGKTVISLKIAHSLKRRTLILVHKSFFLEQWSERIRQFLPNASIGVIRQSKADMDADFVIAMIQTIVKRDYGDALRRFGTIIIDECHHLGAPVFMSALFKQGLEPAYVLGCSATPDRADGLTRLLEYGMGKMVDTNDENSQLEGSQREIVHVKMIKYNGGKRKEIKRGDFINTTSMTSDIINDDERNFLIASNVKVLYEKNHQVIIFSERIDQLNTLCTMVTSMGIPQKDVAYYYGKTKSSERTVAAQRRVILSTLQMAREGLDIQTLSACVFATPIANVDQAVGRIQRPCPTNG